MRRRRPRRLLRRPVSASDFSFRDGERLIRFGDCALADAADLIEQRGLGGYALLTTERAVASAPAAIEEGAEVVLHVPHGGVPEAAAGVREDVGGRPIVALGGGRVVDSAKAIAGADGLRCAAIPTTLAGSSFTGVHRMPAGVEGFTTVRPALVVCEPALMASAPLPALAATAMNALAVSRSWLTVRLRLSPIWPARSGAMGRTQRLPHRGWRS